MHKATGVVPLTHRLTIVVDAFHHRESLGSIWIVHNRDGFSAFYKAVLHAVGLERPPLHLALGSDAVDALATELDRQLAELEQWASLSRSTAVDA